MTALLYDLQSTLRVAEQVKTGVRVTHSYYTQVDAFSVVGGLQRYIWKDGRGKIGDADVMSEFYQARQFRNIAIQKKLNRETLIIKKIYYLKLPFEITFVAQTLSPSSGFRSLQLDAKNARIVEPPNRDSRSEALFIEFSDPKIFYWHEKGRSAAPVIVKEEI